MIVLGIDFGSKRIGLAISDALAEFAFPLETLHRKAMAQDLRALKKLAVEREVGAIVVGLPLHMNGQAGPEAEAARNFAKRLAAETSLPVELIDERLTTAEAQRVLRAGGTSGSKRRSKVDAVAASIILRTYLEQQRSLAARADKGDA
jgi:putative Holliday junction resolvase